MKEKQLNRIKIALESGAVPYVIRESERIAHLIPDFTSFEQECYWRIGKALLAFRDNGREKKALIQKIIRSVKADFLTGKKRRIRYDTSFEGEDGTVWEPEDISANVVGEVLLKEKTALLAQDDPRKKTILAIWNRGCTNDSEISSLLAKRFGGNPESHRKFIQRFRAHCQSQLTA
ncbi:hypothetical protein [Bacillus licheniformis]|uniref:hypothetical protein n=1 Tax=Bacillus licheniformis TaxID=1402 RepID=UPI0011A09FB8|nr:hypothetical protein [Bacillus licheniformis]MDQ9094265.1 hypothetical protein [Bacillus licheniformis]MEC0477148.1 hypothetical protein [Bacillus licheniformis]MEC0490090.1 hypothetical protein [Bacillus licheniformis]